MNGSIDRRTFLGASLAAGGAFLARGHGAARAAEGAPAGKLRKAVVAGMLGKLPEADRFTIARDLGFEGIEAYTTDDPAAAERMRAAADKAGIAIHSVMNSNHWEFPLSSADPKAIEKGLEGMRTSLRNAKVFGADTVLLVPAVVNEKTRYAEAMARSKQHIPQLIPLAEELGVAIAIENVWNKFLLSPLEFADYVDGFKTPAVKAYFDVGNIVLYGYPEDWIRTLGRRIVKVHIKDFNRKGNQFVPLREGSIVWPEVRRALAEIGYSGWITAELGGGDEAYLREVSKRMDLIIAGE